MLKTVLLDESLQKTFWNHVNQDPVDHHFFIFDLKQHPDETKVWMALEGDKVNGLLLVHRNYIVQFRGNREAVKALLEGVKLKEVELQAPLDCEDLVLAKYRPKIRQEMMLMTVRKGEERVQITTQPERLDENDAEGIAELLRKADPVWWGEVEAERLRARMAETINIGIRQDGRLVSVGIARLTGYASNISTIATDERYRNRGYATSIVCALVKEILETSEVAMIHVIKDNAPAVRAYAKAGFKPCKTYLSIRT